ncbi:ArsR family transcriptional regulator [Kribbella italica]|uniref:DNA-binding transcriptional ArsR family regulator n=1 Tax=Kribbella italica TaxID=1540520 RepID=A0A7W9J5C8_9ACTN|nr:DNA-binding transcriptional ArsR family regulator [Kribbella italica]
MNDARIPPHPELGDIALQQVLEAIVDPVRRSIVTQLARSTDDIKCGGFDLAVSTSTATHHFKVLREAGLIRQYYLGTSRLNTLRREEVDRVFPGLLDSVVAAESRQETRKTAGVSRGAVRP